ncbi:MAG: hypothetical protein U9N82_10060, partial [Thermodesulfobacteriota bacterium]|nr:hypothetical protein [Thermodesulfobacteriota bacterium]
FEEVNLFNAKNDSTIFAAAIKGLFGSGHRTAPYHLLVDSCILTIRFVVSAIQIMAFAVGG